MNELLEFLKRIDDRLAAIESLMAKPKVAEIVSKSSYSCTETSELSQTFGVKKYRPYTIRLACSDGRIPEAAKRDDGSWALPQQIVLRILSDGLPPERRRRARPVSPQQLRVAVND